jgi:hypothetical protein
MGFVYAPNTPISFPYAGIQVEAQSNLLSFGNGRQTLVDFGDLYGDAGKAIKATGIDIVEFPPLADPFDVISRLLETAPMEATESPVFYAADRSEEFNTAITVTGILVREKNQLFLKKQLPEQIERFVRSEGMQPVVIEVSTAE